ncbi:MAG: hemolysin family protein [Stackebrandtia sp.]
MDSTLISTVLPLAAFIALIAANGFFVAAEFSFVTVDRPSVEIAAQAGDRRARSVSRALKSLSFQLSGAQLGITITALMTGYLAEPALASLIEPRLGVFGAAASGIAIAIGMIVANLLSMLFGELVPKNAALARPFPVARATATPQRMFSRGFSRLIGVLNGSANWIVRRLGIEPQEELATARSPEELRLLAAMSARAGALPRDTAVLLQRTLRFGDRRAAEAMTPRVDLTALPVEATIDDLVRAAVDTGLSRFPIYEGTRDQIVGVAELTDALGVPPSLRGKTAVRTVSREPIFVSEHLDLNTLATRLRHEGVDLAVVIDEYGGTDGIVTVEDLAEELVGEIADEHDPADVETSTHVEAAGVPTFLVAGDLHEDEVAEHTGFRMPDGPYETLAGFLMAQLGHIPEFGESVDYDGWEFTVVDVERRRVEQVRVRPPDDWEPSGDFVGYDPSAAEEGRR